MAKEELRRTRPALIYAEAICSRAAADIASCRSEIANHAENIGAGQGNLDLRLVRRELFDRQEPV